jgi:hypothetical protein
MIQTKFVSINANAERPDVHSLHFRVQLGLQFMAIAQKEYAFTTGYVGVQAPSKCLTSSPRLVKRKVSSVDPPPFF